MTRALLRVFIGLFPCLLLYSCQPSETAAPPNVIFILTDDQGWGDIGAHGNTLVETPVLDQFITESASFNKFYVSPLCAPSRASFLSGRYHLRTGTVSVSQGMERMRPSEITIAELLKDAGYATGCFGKWHNGSNYPENPQGQGFQRFVGFSAGHWNNYFDTELEYDGQFRKSSGYISDVITDESLAFIEENGDGPFFCYIPYNAPHGPFQVPDAYFNKYREKELDDRLAAIYAMVENLDHNIGRILQKLRDLGLSKNTIVIFATDNGPNGQRYNGNMKGWKGKVDEGGVRVPFIVRWPGKIAAGYQIEPAGSHIDFLPTVMDLVGLSLPQDIDGISLAPVLLQEEDQIPQRTIYTHVNFMTELYPYPGAVRDGRYLLTVKEDGNELFDLFGDPGQEDNLINEIPKVARELLSKYHSWFQEVTRETGTKPPIPAGHLEFPQVSLYPQEAMGITDSLQYQEGHGWAHDWLVNWKSPEDSVWWPLQLAEPTTYQVFMEYTVPDTDLGGQVLVRAGQQEINATITRAFDPDYIPSPDRVPRIEVYEKEWARLEIGSVTLPAGRLQVVLKALEVPGSQVCEFR
ncbi:MAG: arylsulfatase, partial [Cyclobacteriaceae bacterium]|nr:arylsulfatase [Cyclobacteriaceae bacterium]